MHITGNGALRDSDISLLRRGAVMILPHDGSGRAVIYYDKSLLFGDPIDTSSLVRNEE